MYAIAIELETQYTNAHAEIDTVLNAYGFKPAQGSLYLTENEDMANLFMAIQSLKTLPWFPLAVRDIRSFRVEMWSDFTSMVKN